MAEAGTKFTTSLKYVTALYLNIQLYITYSS